MRTRNILWRLWGQGWGSNPHLQIISLACCRYTTSAITRRLWPANFNCSRRMAWPGVEPEPLGAITFSVWPAAYKGKCPKKVCLPTRHHAISLRTRKRLTGIIVGKITVKLWPARGAGWNRTSENLSLLALPRGQVYKKGCLTIRRRHQLKWTSSQARNNTPVTLPCGPLRFTLSLSHVSACHATVRQ